MTTGSSVALPESSYGANYVVVVSDEGGSRHERVTLDSAGGLLIGRGWHCDLIVQDLQVDAEHARVSIDSTGELRVDDLDSLNGVQLTRVTPEGGELQLGTSTLAFHRADAPVPPAQRPPRWNTVLGWIGRCWCCCHWCLPKSILVPPENWTPAYLSRARFTR